MLCKGIKTIQIRRVAVAVAVIVVAESIRQKQMQTQRVTHTHTHTSKQTRTVETATDGEKQTKTDVLSRYALSFNSTHTHRYTLCMHVYAACSLLVLQRTKMFVSCYC